MCRCGYDRCCRHRKMNMIRLQFQDDIHIMVSRLSITLFLNLMMVVMEVMLQMVRMRVRIMVTMVVMVGEI